MAKTFLFLFFCQISLNNSNKFKDKLQRLSVAETDCWMEFQVKLFYSPCTLNATFTHFVVFLVVFTSVSLLTALCVNFCDMEN